MFKKTHSLQRKLIYFLSFFIFGVIIIYCLLPQKTSASVFSVQLDNYLKTYPLNSSDRIRAYALANTNSKKIGTVFGEDLIYILKTEGNWLYCSYPTKVFRKKGWIKLSSVSTQNLKKSTNVAKAKITTYVYPSSDEISGSISKNDSVTSVASSGNYTQVIYPAFNYYKLAWIKTSDYNNFITKISTTPSSTEYANPVSSSSAYFRKPSNDDGMMIHHDINGVKKNDKVYAIADGTVTYLQYYRTINGKKTLTSYGNCIKFTSKNKRTTAFYAHLNKFANVSLKIPSTQTTMISGRTGSYTLKTKSVKKGEVIGYIGTTGNSTGVHMHFTLTIDNKRVDPSNYFTLKAY